MPKGDLWPLSKWLPDYAEIHGTPGPDTLFGGLARVGSHIYGGDGVDIVFAGIGDDTVWGGNEKDLLHGEDGVDTLYGEAGWDELFGEGGNDFLYGGAGCDRLDGGVGADEMAGGTDSDLYFVDDHLDQVIENVGEGNNDEVISFLDTYTLGANVEHLYLQGLAEEGHGNAFNNRVFGNELANLISGEGGRDELKGFDGEDRIFGGADNDTITGGMGRDELTGDGGADTFAWVNPFETGTHFSGTALATLDVDVVTDFNPMEGDKLDLTGVARWLGVQHLTFVDDQPFTAPGQVAFWHDFEAPQDNYIHLNIDSDRQTDAIIQVHTPWAISPADASWFDL